MRQRVRGDKLRVMKASLLRTHAGKQESIGRWCPVFALRHSFVEVRTLRSIISAHLRLTCAAPSRRKAVCVSRASFRME